MFTKKQIFQAHSDGTISSSYEWVINDSEVDIYDSIEADAIKIAKVLKCSPAEVLDTFSQFEIKNF